MVFRGINSKSIVSKNYSLPRKKISQVEVYILILFFRNFKSKMMRFHVKKTITVWLSICLRNQTKTRSITQVFSLINKRIIRVFTRKTNSVMTNKRFFLFFESNDIFLYMIGIYSRH